MFSIVDGWISGLVCVCCREKAGHLFLNKHIPDKLFYWTSSQGRKLLVNKTVQVIKLIGAKFIVNYNKRQNSTRFTPVVFNFEKNKNKKKFIFPYVAEWQNMSQK